MGSDFQSWDEATGAMYMGAHTEWEIIWTLVAASLCVYAIYKANRHEHKVYKQLNDDDKS